MDVMDMRRGLMMAMASGKGFPDKEFFVRTESEMTLKDFLTAHPIPLRYNDEMCFVRYYNDNAASTGGTFNWTLFFVEGQRKNGFLMNWTNSTVAPNSMININTVSSYNGSYFAIISGSIAASTSTNTTRRVAAGTDVYVIHIPFNWTNFSTQSTEL